LNDLDFLLSIREQFYFDHCYGFDSMQDVFQNSLSLVMKRLGLNGIGLSVVGGKGKSKSVHKGLLTGFQEKVTEDSPYAQSKHNIHRLSDERLIIPVRRAKRVIGILQIEGQKLGQISDSLLILLGNLFANPLHQWVKSCRINKATTEGPKTTFNPQTMIGHSKLMIEVFSMMEKVFKSNITVLILGESGVGKERVANEIHLSGVHSGGPLVSLNCAAIPTDLIESELFGHEKGAFTGAIDKKIGKFELAHEGTLFLDEVGDLPIEAQAKILRAIQEKKVTRIGGKTSINCDVRIIAATNVDLEKRIKERRFREDLFYRLNVFPISIPPLRERKDDIIPLSDHFIKKFSRENNKNIRRISTSALDMFMAYDWPGNIRELANVIERAVLMSDDGVISGRDLPPSLQMPDDDHIVSIGSLESYLNQVEKDIIIDSLKSNKGNMRKASSKLGLTERKMGLRVMRHNINLKRFKKSTYM